MKYRMRRDRSTLMREILCSIHRGNILITRIVRDLSIDSRYGKEILAKLIERRLIYETVENKKVLNAYRGRPSNNPKTYKKIRYSLSPTGREAVKHILKAKQLLGEKEK